MFFKILNNMTFYTLTDVKIKNLNYTMEFLQFCKTKKILICLLDAIYTRHKMNTNVSLRSCSISMSCTLHQLYYLVRM